MVAPHHRARAVRVDRPPGRVQDLRPAEFCAAEFCAVGFCAAGFCAAGF